LWTRSTFAKDNFDVYCYGNIIKGADAQSFELLPQYYVKDKFSVYYGGKKIQGATARTFQPIGNPYAEDGSNVYADGNKVDTDYDSFQVLGNYYAKDSLNVFFYGKKRIGTISDSFQPLIAIMQRIVTMFTILII
jgi:hypothetical protein